MNRLDNGVKDVLKVVKVCTDNECYFSVTFRDWYNEVRTKRVMVLDEFIDSTWVE